MTKYHINPQTGNPNICRAKPGNCPHGSPDEHYPSKEDARKAYEEKQEVVTRAAQKFQKSPVGTVVEFEDGVRFVKTNNDLWETSSKGGFAMENVDLVSYGQNPRLVQDEPAVVQKKSPPAKGAINVSLLQQSSWEKGNQSRKYFLLLNHRDPEMVAAYNGKVEDQAVIDTIIQTNNAEAKVAELQAKLNKNVFRRENAKSDAQRAGYSSLIERTTSELDQASTEFEQKKIELDQHMKKYAKQYVLHYRSLDSLERLVEKGVRSNPPGLSERIAKLETMQKNAVSVNGLVDLANSDNSADVYEAAKKFGHPAYIQAAKTYHDTSVQLSKLEENERILNQTHNKLTVKSAKNAVAEEILELQHKKQNLLEEKEKTNARLALFRDDIRDRDFMETALDREISVLKKMGNLD